MSGKLESRPLERYFQVLERLADTPDGMLLVEIAAALDLPGATAHRLVNALVDGGLVSRAPEGKHYGLGTRARRFGLATLARDSLEDRMGETLADLAHELGQTTYVVKLARYEVDSVVVREPVASSQPILHPGRSMALHAAATGKAIFAYQSDEFIAQVLSRPIRQFTSDTKVRPEAIRAELAEVRAARFAVCDNEMDSGVLSYATPLMSADGSVFFALGTCGLKSRFAEPRREAVRALLMERAAELARRLGLLG